MILVDTTETLQVYDTVQWNTTLSTVGVQRFAVWVVSHLKHFINVTIQIEFRGIRNTTSRLLVVSGNRFFSIKKKKSLKVNAMTMFAKENLPVMRLGRRLRR